MRFVIKKGTHYSIGWRHLFPICFKKKMDFTFKLSQECLFPFRSKDDDDVNKLYGVSFGLPNPFISLMNIDTDEAFDVKIPNGHHKDSIRLGWVPSFANKGKYYLFLYCYNAGVRKEYHLCELLAEVGYVARSTFDKINNQFTIEVKPAGITGSPHKVFTISYKYPKALFWYKLFPYFGGNKKAPHDMTIDINDL